MDRKRLLVEPFDAGNDEVTVKPIYPEVCLAPSSVLHCLGTCTDKADTRSWAQRGSGFTGKLVCAQQRARN